MAEGGPRQRRCAFALPPPPLQHRAASPARRASPAGDAQWMKRERRCDSHSHSNSSRRRSRRLRVETSARGRSGANHLQTQIRSRSTFGTPAVREARPAAHRPHRPHPRRRSAQQTAMQQAGWAGRATAARRDEPLALVSGPRVQRAAAATAAALAGALAAAAALAKQAQLASEAAPSLRRTAAPARRWRRHRCEDSTHLAALRAACAPQGASSA